MLRLPLLSLFISGLILGNSYSVFGQIPLFAKGNQICAGRSGKDKTFLEAVKRGNDKLIWQFLQKGADANLQDNCNIPVIYYAASTSRPNVLKMLIESGAKINIVNGFDSQTPLLAVIESGDYKDEQKNIYESVNILIKSGADVNLVSEFKKSALIAAVLSENEKITELLISAGADVNYEDSNERTAYSYAAQSGNKVLKRILIESGADTSIGVAEYQKMYAENAFYQASADGRTDVVEAMLAIGTNVNISNGGKMTALMRATEDSTVDSLINAGANVNLKDNIGFTALIWAAAFGRKSQVVKLIAAGADVNARTNDGKTALDLVKNSETRAVLLEAGANIKE